jgi:2-iminobutanoate/2-iminopropanoate deaminase
MSRYRYRLSRPYAGLPRRRPAAPDFLSSPAHLAMGLPFCEAVRAGDLLFMSGQIGNLPGTHELAPGGIDAQARQTLENLRVALDFAGAGLNDVIKCTVFLADIAEWPAFNAVYREFFPHRPPARSAFAASGLALGARVELEAIAWCGTRR